jgi:hypothetical protein
MTRDAVRIEVRNPAGDVEFREFADRRALRIGSDPACELRLDGAGVPLLHSLIEPRSNHWVLHLARNGALPKDYTRRVDYGTIEVGGYAIRVLPPPEELE